MKRNKHDQLKQLVKKPKVMIYLLGIRKERVKNTLTGSTVLGLRRSDGRPLDLSTRNGLVEETLRFELPIELFRRFLESDTVLEGVLGTATEGEGVFLARETT